MKNDQEFVPDEWAEGLSGTARLIKAKVAWFLFSMIRIPYTNARMDSRLHPLDLIDGREPRNFQKG